LQHTIFYMLVRLRAVWVARFLLRVVVFYYALLPSVRARALPYVRRRFAPSGSLSAFGHVFRLYLAFGRILLERIIAGVTGRFSLDPAPCPERKRFLKALNDARGCIVLTGHVGPWQLGMAWPAGAGRPVHIVQHRDPGDVDSHYFEHGKGPLVNILDAADPGALAGAAAALRRGEIVCLMGDRLLRQGAEGEKSVLVPFLHGLIRLPTTAYALASITGAALAIVFVVMTETGIRAVYAECLHIPPALPRKDPDVFLPYAARFAQGMEDVTRRYPYQFYNFYDLWRPHA
jgi:predicted LPLAT superfamily acyltransferase